MLTDPESIAADHEFSQDAGEQHEPVANAVAAGQ